MKESIGPVLRDLLEERGASIHNLKKFRELLKAEGCVECARDEPSSDAREHFHADSDRAATFLLTLRVVPMGPGFTSSSKANARHALLTLLELVLERP